eukprot:scaffold12827_cov123-Isochrysis_galbana.AAC.2
MRAGAYEMGGVRGISPPLRPRRRPGGAAASCSACSRGGSLTSEPAVSAWPRAYEPPPSLRSRPTKRAASLWMPNRWQV